MLYRHTHWPKVLYVDTLTGEHVISKSWASLWCYNSLCYSYFGTWLQRFVPIQTQERQWGPTVMLGNEEAWLTGCVLVHPKGFGWGWGQYSVQASSLKWEKTFSLVAWLCAWGSCCLLCGPKADTDLKYDEWRGFLKRLGKGWEMEIADWGRGHEGDEE